MAEKDSWETVEVPGTEVEYEIEEPVVEQAAREEPEVKEPVDTMPHDSQPPGVDEETEPQSLEEALVG